VREDVPVGIAGPPGVAADIATSPAERWRCFIYGLGTKSAADAIGKRASADATPIAAGNIRRMVELPSDKKIRAQIAVVHGLTLNLRGCGHPAT
jgi:hypothetical protein